MKKLLIFILAVALLARLLIAWQPVPLLIEKIVVDDSFYGIDVARNIATGHGITYNGIDQTNGFQPLWVFMMVPILYFTSDIYLAINIIITLLALLDVFIAFLIYKYTRQYFDEKISILAAFIWAVNPFIMFQTLQGIDVTIYVLLLMSALVWYNKIKDNLTLKNSAILGLLMGMLIMARGDGIFLFVIITTHILWKGIKSMLSKEFISIILITILVASPWLIRSYLTFGAITQSSQIANYYMRRGLIPFYDISSQNSIIDILKSVSESLIRAFGSIAHQLGMIDFNIGLTTAIVIPLLIMILYSFKNNWRKFAIPIMFSIITIIFYSAYMMDVQIRYMTPIMPFIFILLAEGIMTIYKERTGMIIILIFLLLVLIVNGFTQWNNGYFLWQRFMYENIIYLDNNITANSTVGSYGSGMLEYFSKNTVINLDGLMNYDAINANLNKSMYSYMKSKNITYWVDTSIHNETVIQIRRDGNFSLPRDHQYVVAFESDTVTKLDVVVNRCGVFKHIRGFDMLICFFIMKIK